MKKLLLHFSFILVFTSTLMAQTAVQPSGSGTSEDPYLVSSIDNLYWITQNSNSWDKYFEQTADLDATGTSTWNSNLGLTHIGNTTIPFNGVYDGKGHTISNLQNIDHGGTTGLFGYINGGRVKNLGLINPIISGGSHTGAIVGLAQNYGSVVENSYVSGGTVTGTSVYVGGLVGSSENAYFAGCFSSANVTGSYHVGGFSGYIYNSVFTNCYATGNANTTHASNGNVGGFGGSALQFSYFINCYSTGSPSATSNSNIGGFVGSVSTYFSYHTFWDVQTSGQASSSIGTGKNTAEMKTLSTFTDVGWDFSSPIWNISSGINNGYPNLQSNSNPHFWHGRYGKGWNEAKNWGAYKVPGATDDVNIPSDTYRGLNIPEGAICNNFRIEKDADVTIQGSFTVNGILTLGVDLNLYTQTLTFGPLGSLVEGDGEMMGHVGLMTTTRDLSGLSSENVAGFGAFITTSADMGSTVVARGFAAQTGNGNQGIKRYYDILPTNNSGLNAAVAFSYKESELNGLDESTLVLFKSTDGGNTWTDMGGILNSSSNIIILTGIDSFGRWTIGSTDASLEAAQIPVVTTDAISSISLTSAISGGNVTDEGSDAVTAKGVCWSTNSSPSIYDDLTSDGTGSGVFTSSISGLNSGETYYVRAYATNSAGTAYGNEIVFTTNELPVITTQEVTEINEFGAIGNGNIISLGNPNPTSYGVCWGTSNMPTVSGSHSDEGTANNTGAFTSTITGLTPGTVYYVRAYATSSEGTVYGEEVSFLTSPLVPLSNWSIWIGFIAIGGFIAFRLIRR